MGAEGERGSTRRGFTGLQDDDLRVERHAPIKIDDVLIQQSDTARGNHRADGPGLHRAVKTIKRVAAVSIKVERTRPQRILRAAFDAAGILAVALGFAADHRWR